MKLFRGCVLLLAAGAIGITLVQLRTSQARSVCASARLDIRRRVLRRELWSLEVRRARFRAPDRIVERVGATSVGVYAPDGGESARTNLMAIRSRRTTNGSPDEYIE